MLNCHFPSIPWETKGRGSKDSSRRTSQKGECRVGGSSIGDPQGRSSRSCCTPSQKARSVAGTSEYTQAPWMRGEEGLTRLESRRCSALHGHSPYALPSAPVATGQQHLQLGGPAPFRLRATPRPHPQCGGAHASRLSRGLGRACSLPVAYSTRDR